MNPLRDAEEVLGYIPVRLPPEPIDEIDRVKVGEIVVALLVFLGTLAWVAIGVAR